MADKKVSGYDLEGARKAEISDEDSLKHLAELHKYDLEGARKAGIPDQESLSYLAQMAAPKAEVYEKESPELFGALTGGAGAIAAAGDVLFSKGRPLFRAAEKVFGLQDPNTQVQPRKFASPSEVAERGIELRTPPTAATATENYMKSGQYISPEGKPLFYGAGEEGGYSGARQAAERAIETEKMYPGMKVLQGQTPIALPREEAARVESQRAETQRLQDAKNQAEINQIAQQRAERLAERERLKGSEARGKIVSGSKTIGSKVGAPIIGGYELGAQGTQAYNRLTREDLQPSDVAAGVANVAGAGMGGYSALPFSKHRLPLAVGSVGMNYLSDLLDKRNPRRSVLEEPEKKAEGGRIGGGLELLKKVLESGKSGKQRARESEYVHKITPTHQFSEPKKLSIQDLQNRVLVGVPGDRSLTGRLVHEVNAVPLTKPVEQYGGPLYGLQQADLGNKNFWASQQGAASALQNKAARAMQEHDRPVVGMYAAMAPDASNYSLHHLETLLNQVPAMNPAKSQVRDFDKMVRQQYPTFAGLTDADLMEQLKRDPKLRKFIADRMNKTTVADMYGLPSGEATLHAITEPALRDVATGTTGFAVGKLDPYAKLTASKHPTYSTNIPGEFEGQMIAQLPWEEYFPDVAKKIAANPKQAKHAWGTFKMGDFNQPVTQELVDRIAPIEEFILDLKKQKKAEGGSIEGYAKGKIVRATKDLILPPAENAARTQIIGTLPTYAKAAELLKQRGAMGRGIDVGAGLGEGSKVLGKNFDTMEPYAKGWNPTYRSAEEMPSDAYGQLTNLNVLNVMPREARDELVQHIGRTMEPGGLGILTTRGADVMKAQGRPGPEDMSIITSRDTYQKGFTKQELEDYLRYMLGDKFDVNKLNLGPAGAMIQKKAEGGSTTPAWQRSEGKNPEGGLNAVGRASYNRETGGNLKAPQPEGGSRKKSFCARMGGMKKKLTSSKTANDPDSRINKALRKWKC